MKEQVLKEYFEINTTAKSLNDDVEGSKVKTGYDTFNINVEQYKPNKEFKVKIHHILKLCDDCLNGFISPKNLNIISFALICSDNFIWEEDTIEDDIITKTVYDWDNPEINYKLTEDNLLLWKEFLMTGNYKLK